MKTRLRDTVEPLVGYLLRTYMIEITYAGKDSALAAVVAKAFAAEFLRSCKLQMLSEQRSLAEAALSRALAMFGQTSESFTREDATGGH